MRLSRKVLAHRGARRSLLVAACSSSGGGAAGASLGRCADAGQVPAAMGRPVAVRGLLRGGRPGLLQGPRPRRVAAARRPEHQQRPGRRDRRRRHRDGLAAEHAPVARRRHGPRRRSPRSSSAPGPGWPASRRPTSPTPAAMAGKKIGSWLGGNEPELFAGADQGRPRPDQGEHHQAELRHVGAAQGRPRRGPGDDLQRVRPGPRGEEPGDRPALQAGRPQRHRLQRPVGRHGDAPGPDLRQRQVAQDRQQRRRRHEVPAGDVQGLDLLPRQPPEVRRHRPRQGLAARRQPPGVADERDQRADLAVAGRHRPARQGAVRPDGQHRHDLQGPEGRPVGGRDPDGPRPEGARRARHLGRHQGRQLRQEARSRSRRAATSRSRHTRTTAGPRGPAVPIPAASTGGHTCSTCVP